MIYLLSINTLILKMNLKESSLIAAELVLEN